MWTKNLGLRAVVALTLVGLIGSAGSGLRGDVDLDDASAGGPIENPSAGTVTVSTLGIGTVPGEDYASVDGNGTFDTLIVQNGLNIAEGTLDVLDLGGVGTLQTFGTQFSGEQVWVGTNEAPPGGVVNVDGGHWTASNWVFYVGYGGDGVVNVTDEGMLDHLQPVGDERWLHLGLFDGSDAGHGTLNIGADGTGGEVYANVVVGVGDADGNGGTGHLEVGDRGVLGDPADPQALRIGSGGGAAGTAVFGAGSEVNLTHITVGGDGGDGTLTIEGGASVSDAVVHVAGPSTLGRVYLEPGFSGTFSDVYMRTSSIAQPDAGEAWFELDDADLQVNENFHAQGYRSGVVTIEVDNGSELRTEGETILGYATGCGVVVERGSAWRAGDDALVELGSQGTFTLLVAEASTWDVGTSGGGGSGGLLVAGGDSTPASKGHRATITIGMTAGSGATWNLRNPAQISYWGDSTIFVNGPSEWTASREIGFGKKGGDTTLVMGDEADCQWEAPVTQYLGDVSITLGGESETTWAGLYTQGGDHNDDGTIDNSGDFRLAIEDNALLDWQRGIKRYGFVSGEFSIEMSGGTLMYHDDHDADPTTRGRFYLDWIEGGYTGGSILASGCEFVWNGAGPAGPLPPMGPGMDIAAGSFYAAHVPDLVGGTIDTEELIVDYRMGGETWGYRDGATGPLTWDALSLSAAMRVPGDFDTGSAWFSWSAGAELMVERRLTLSKETRAGYAAPVYLIDHRSAGIDGSLARCDTDDGGGAPVVLDGEFGFEWTQFTVGGFGQWETARVDLIGSARVLIDGGGWWTSRGEVNLLSDMAGYQPPTVQVDGGLWVSEGAVNIDPPDFLGAALGALEEDLLPPGVVNIAADGVWEARAGYACDPDNPTVHLRGGTLVYGVAGGPMLAFDPIRQLGTFEDGSTLIVHGLVTSPVSIGAGSRISGVQFVDVSVLSGGVFAPGASPAASTVDGAYFQESQAAIEMEIYGSILGDEYDHLTVTGELELGGELMILLRNYRPALNATFDLFDWSWEISDGTFADGVTFDTPGYAATLDYPTGVLTITGVPEPATLAMFGLVGGAALLRRTPGRRRR